MDHVNYSSTVKVGQRFILKPVTQRPYCSQNSYRVRGKIRYKRHDGKIPRLIRRPKDTSYVCNQIRELLQSSEQELSK